MSDTDGLLPNRAGEAERRMRRLRADLTTARAEISRLRKALQTVSNAYTDYIETDDLDALANAMGIARGELPVGRTPDIDVKQ